MKEALASYRDGDYKGAESRFDRIMQSLSVAPGGKTSRRYTDALYFQGAAYAGGGEDEKAEQCFRGALRLQQYAVPLDVADIVRTLAAQVNVLERMGRCVEAVDTQGQRLEIERKLFSPGDPQLTRTSDRIDAIIVDRVGKLMNSHDPRLNSERREFYERARKWLGEESMVTINLAAAIKRESK